MLSQLRQVFQRRALYLPMLGLALFWSVGQGMLAAFPAYAKAYAHIDNTAVIQAILACTALGIAAGAVLVGVNSGGRIRISWVPMGIVGLSMGLWLLAWLQNAWLFALDYFLMGVCSAMLIVPLNALIQLQMEERSMGATIAGSNLIQNIAMLSMLGLTIGFSMASFDSRALLLLMAGLTTVLGALFGLLIVRLRL